MRVALLILGVVVGWAASGMDWNRDAAAAEPTRTPASESVTSSAVLKAKILDAWRRRNRGVTSVIVKADLQHLIRGRGAKRPSLSGPFAEPRPVEDRTLPMELDYATEGRKVAFETTSETISFDDPEKTVLTKFRMAFDGEQNSSLSVARMSLGGIEISKEPNPILRRNLMLLAIQMSLDPLQTIRDAGGSVEDVKIDDNTIDVGGISCQRLRLKGPSRKAIRTLDVAPSLDWLPLQWQASVNGKPTLTLTLDYEILDDGPRLTDWTLTTLMGVDKKLDTWRGHVAKLELNRDVDDSRFKVVFPVGTHIAREEKGKFTYFIQEEGRLKQIEQKEFGRQGPDEVAALR